MRHLLISSVLVITLLLNASCKTKPLPLEDDVTGFLQSLHQAQKATEAKQWSRAVALWDTVTKQNPVTGDYWLQLATARYNTRDFRGAIAAYEKTESLG